MSRRYPIIIGPKKSIIFDDVDIYLSPALYAKNKSFMKAFKETGQVNVTSDMLQLFRRQLRDQNYNVSKIYGFKNLVLYNEIEMKEDDFALPDFKIHVKLKDQSSSDLIKETLEFSYSVLETDRKV